MKKVKRINTDLQFVVGLLSVGILWLTGIFSGSLWFYSESLFLSCILPLIGAILIPVLVMVFAYISKRYSMKFMYIAALVASGVPLVSSILSAIFSDDGSILSWIYGLTIGWMLYPFSLLSWSVFDGVSSFFFVFTEEFVGGDSLKVLMVIMIIASLIVYKVTKPVKNCPK